MNNKKIYQVDAFCNQAFKGNPAGVMILETPLVADVMQSIAMEMNLSETAFIVKNDSHFAIRYFTPTTEVPLCGHATLASAHMLYELELVQPEDAISFKAKFVNLTVQKEADWIRMIFPKYPLMECKIPKNFKSIIGFEPMAMYSSDDQWQIALAEKETTIKEANPNFESMEPAGLGHLMITAPSALKDYDFVVRCFAPMSGINEDPVTGSAHCALTPLWSERLKKKEMTSLQCSKRTGILKVENMADEVVIKGKAITMFEADLRF